MYPYVYSARQLLFSNLPAVGHCVSVLLETLQSFTSKTLRQHALAALLALSGIDENSLTLLLSNTEVKNSPQIDQISSRDGCNKYLDGLVDTLGVGPEDCGHVFACFLPGITMVITKLVTSETNLGSSVTVLSLLTWAHYVALVMKDSECSTPEIEASKGSNYDKVSEDDLSRKKLEVQRSLSWQQETDSKLCVLVQRMSGLVTSESWRSRLGLVGWAHILLSHSYRYIYTHSFIVTSSTACSCMYIDYSEVKSVAPILGLCLLCLRMHNSLCIGAVTVSYFPLLHTTPFNLTALHHHMHTHLSTELLRLPPHTSSSH